MIRSRSGERWLRRQPALQPRQVYAAVLPQRDQSDRRGRGVLRLRAGGSIYDLAALLWGRRTDGRRDFVELRRELRRRLG